MCYRVTVDFTEHSHSASITSWTFIGIQKYLLNTIAVSPWRGATFIVRDAGRMSSWRVKQKKKTKWVMESSKNYSPRAWRRWPMYILFPHRVRLALRVSVWFVLYLLDLWLVYLSPPHELENMHLELFSFTKLIIFIFIVCICMYMCTWAYKCPQRLKWS